MDWLAYKDEAARLAFEKDALHIYAALAVQLAAAWLSRRTLGHMLPWIAVLAVECGNELFDFLSSGEREMRPWQVVAAVHDLFNTMILPTVLLVLSRRAPQLFAFRRSPAPSSVPVEARESEAGLSAEPQTDRP